MSSFAYSTDRSSADANRRQPTDKFARDLVHQRLSGLRGGNLVIDDPSGTTQFGSAPDLRAHLRVRHNRFYRSVLLGGALAAGETFVQGDWECDDLTSLLRMFARDASSTRRMNRGFAALLSVINRLLHWRRANTRSGSRRNIAAHYDLGNDFYQLWLDETLAYSSGIFLSKSATLHEASVEKFDRVCRLLNIKQGDDVIEIGGGWGGFAIHAAANYGCRVTTTTISPKQYELARERIRNAGLSDRVTLLQSDYRELEGQYDKLVSIEMIEAVGYRFLDRFFQRCSLLLKPHGSMMLQAIVMPERGYDRYLQTPDFINRYVFPGGCLPSLGAILASIARATDLRFVQADDHAADYAETLRRWRSSFTESLAEVRGLGHSEEFIRLWTYYLCYCEAAFEERCIGLLQILFDKPASRR